MLARHPFSPQQSVSIDNSASFNDGADVPAKLGYVRLVHVPTRCKTALFGNMGG